MLQDLRYGVRVLFQNKSWTAVAVVSLAIGIGASTALFSVVDSILFMQLPVRNPQNLVLLDWVSGPRTMSRISGTSIRDPTTRSVASTAFSTLAFERFRAESKTLSDVFAFHDDEFNLTTENRSELVSGQFVSGNYFESLGITPIRGRAIEAHDDSASADAVAVISYDYWRKRFNGDAGIVGRSMLLNGVPFIVIGVTPREFRGIRPLDEASEVSIAMAAERRVVARSGNQRSPLDSPGTWWVTIMGRLRSGVAESQAQAELNNIFLSAAREGTQSTDRDTPVLRVLNGSRGFSYFRDYANQYGTQSRVLAGIVVAVLLIVCANVANLLLGRAANRRKEVFIRVAIGARRHQLLR